MDRNQAKELLPIIKAFSEGKVIQILHVDGTWEDAKYLNFGRGLIYRIKPESEYRPFKNAEECWTEMEKHSPFGWVKDYDGSKFTIETVDSGDSSIYVSDEGTCSFGEVFEKFKFADGTPFGAKVE